MSQKLDSLHEEIHEEALIAAIDFLLENHADLTIKDASGKTAYDYAKEQGLDIMEGQNNLIH